MADSYDLSPVTLTQLRYLVSVGRVRSFRAAAEECHVSQPALSVQIQKLEEILRVRVFDRTHQPIVPTDIGHLILRQAVVVLREAQRFVEIADSSEKLAGTYRLGVLPTLAPTLLPRFLPTFARTHPNVCLVIEELQTREMIGRLQSDTLDGGFAATPLQVPGLNEQQVCYEPLSVYLPPNHAFQKQTRIRQSQLVDELVWLMPEGHCFRSQVLHLCKIDRSVQRASNLARVQFESGSFETLIGLVDAGFGLTILPELVVRSFGKDRRKTRVRPFSGPTPVREISFVHVREHLRRAIGDALAETVKQSLPQELTERRTGQRARVIAPA